jgi:hypothetical protein
MDEGPWTIGGAIAAIVAAVVIIYSSGYEFIFTPWRRRRKLRKPCKAWFLIPASNQRHISYAVQDHSEHRVEELTLRANHEIEIEFLYEPQVTSEISEIYFGCEAQDNLSIEAKPLINAYCNRFIERGTSEENPETHPDTNYTDHHKFYHIKKPKVIARNECYSVGCKIQTRQAGRYEFKLFLVGEEVGHTRNRLFIRVEDTPTTRMRCALGKHRWSGCFIQPL